MQIDSRRKPKACFCYRKKSGTTKTLISKRVDLHKKKQSF